MINNKRYRPYEEKFIFFSNIIEKIIWNTTILLIIIMVVFQLLLTVDDVRKWVVPIEILEGALHYFPVLN